MAIPEMLTAVQSISAIPVIPDTSKLIPPIFTVYSLIIIGPLLATFLKEIKDEIDRRV